MSDDRPDLGMITLVAVTSIAIAATARAVARSMARARFGQILWLSDQPPPASIAGLVTWRPIEPIKSRAQYSRFMLHQLAAHITTSHALCVQWDGHVLDGKAWSANFLAYDYIGAPWPHFSDGYDVGNGGFSLRSRRLLEACQNLATDTGEPEDVIICRTLRPTLEQHAGIRFAPRDLASHFAFERDRSAGTSFGFHGVFNLVKLISQEESRELLSSLEPSLIAPNESREVLRWALRRGYWRLAWIIIRRIHSTGRADRREPGRRR